MQSMDDQHIYARKPTIIFAIRLVLNDLLALHTIRFFYILITAGIK
jgi:hypothetical protein